jgi:vacuolar protein sorting-associated protein 8
MSSDSEESHASAHESDGGHTYRQGSIVPDTPVVGHDVDEFPVLTRPNTEEEEHVDSPVDLESLPSENNGLTFARRGRPHPKSETGEEESGSELAIRSATKRAGSPESISTPDDTPSIQVRESDG